jgi:hypothetical protein
MTMPAGPNKNWHWLSRLMYDIYSGDNGWPVLCLPLKLLWRFVRKHDA